MIQTDVSELDSGKSSQHCSEREVLRTGALLEFFPCDGSGDAGKITGAGTVDGR